jgi:hypothetical protein
MLTHLEFLSLRSADENQRIIKHVTQDRNWRAKIWNCCPLKDFRFSKRWLWIVSSEIFVLLATYFALFHLWLMLRHRIRRRYGPPKRRLTFNGINSAITHNRFGLETREYGRRDLSRWPRGTLYPQKLALTSPTSGGRSVGIVRFRTKATE